MNPETAAWPEVDFIVGNASRVARNGRQTALAEKIPARIHLVSQILSSGKKPLSTDAIAQRIAVKGSWKQSLPTLIDTLIALGRARRVKTGVLAID
jgi:hypothetical protein